jgi:hypothetical protein
MKELQRPKNVASKRKIKNTSKILPFFGGSGHPIV